MKPPSKTLQKPKPQSSPLPVGPTQVDYSQSNLARNQWPDLWHELVDEVLPRSLRNKPEELRKPVIDLSNRLGKLAESRMNRLQGPKSAQYPELPHSQDAYLIYFLPFQAAKFLTLFDLHQEFLDARIPKIIKRKKSIRILDLGAGPGTASFAALIYLLSRFPELEKIDLVWCDQSEAFMKRGEHLLNQWLNACEIEPGRVRVELKTIQFSDSKTPDFGAIDWLLCGHLFSEFSNQEVLHVQALYEKILTGSTGAPPPELGILTVEASNRVQSQTLSALRDSMLKKFPTLGILGPCLHAKACPLASGNEWCHFSIRADIPGQWLSYFSKAISRTEREWLKLSFAWWVPELKFKVTDPSLRVVSDPIRLNPKSARILLCQPEKLDRQTVTFPTRLRRGGLFFFKRIFEPGKPKIHPRPVRRLKNDRSAK